MQAEISHLVLPNSVPQSYCSLLPIYCRASSRLSVSSASSALLDGLQEEMAQTEHLMNTTRYSLCQSPADLPYPWDCNSVQRFLCDAHQARIVQTCCNGWWGAELLAC